MPATTKHSFIVSAWGLGRSAVEGSGAGDFSASPGAEKTPLAKGLWTTPEVDAYPNSVSIRNVLFAAFAPLAASIGRNGRGCAGQPRGNQGQGPATAGLRNFPVRVARV
jgi:hypothetical protein